MTADGTSYSLALDSANPQTTEYTYNPATGTLNVFPPTSSTITYQGIAATAQAQAKRYFEIPIDANSIVARWNLSGAFKIERSFEDHPRVTGLKATVAESEEVALKQEICNGNVVEFLGDRWRVSGVQTQRIPQSNPRAVRIEFELTGIHAPYGDPAQHPLDEEQQIKKLAGNARSIPLSRLHPYSGPSIKIPVPKGTSNDTTLTARQQIEERALSQKCFVYYSGAIPAMRPWGQTTLHYLSDRDFLSAGVETTPGFGPRVNGVKLAKEYDNVAVSLEEDPDESERLEEETYCLRSGDDRPKRPPSEHPYAYYITKESIRSPSACFDAGGTTKEDVKTFYQAGKKVRQEKKIYGWRFTSLDTHVATSSTQSTGPGTTETVLEVKFKGDVGTLGGITQYWGQVALEVETFNYRDEDGYLDPISKSGWRYTRHLSETSKLEAVLADNDINAIAAELAGGVSADEAAQLEARQEALEKKKLLYSAWHKLPINDETTHILTPLANFYSDAVESEDEVVPMFASRVERVDRSQLLAEDPESTTESPRPPLIAGKNFREVSQVNIVSPRLPKQPAKIEKYTVQKLTQNQEGAGLDNSLKIGITEEFKGRPSVHERLERNNRSDTRSPRKPETPNYEYRLVSTGHTPDFTKPPRSTVSYVGVSDAEKAKQVAEVALSFANSRSARSFNLSVYPNRSYQEGDRLIWNSIQYDIFGISESGRIYPGRVLMEATELELGQHLSPAVTLYRRVKCN